MINTIYIILALVGFLIVLNGFLRGRMKAQIDIVLGMLAVGPIIIAFFIAGWKAGLIALAIVFISAAITLPIAARLASKLMS